MPIRLDNLPALVSQADQARSRAKASPAAQTSSAAGAASAATKVGSSEAARPDDAVVVARRADPRPTSPALDSPVRDAEAGVEMARELAAKLAGMPGAGVQAQAGGLPRGLASLLN